MDPELEQLAKVERDLQAIGEHIARQRLLIEERRRDGRDTVLAEQLLRTFLACQALQGKHVALLDREIRQRPGTGGEVVKLRADLPCAMTTYYFNLLTQEGVICDPEGTDLADFSSAWEHARGVACELMRDNELRTRSWRLDVCDSSGRVCFHLLFAAVDETLDELPPELRNSIERCCTAAASLNETIHASRLTLFETKALLAHSEGRPYLAAINGLKVA